MKAYKIYEVGLTKYTIEAWTEHRTACFNCENLDECCKVQQLLSDLGFEDLSDDLKEVKYE